MQYWNNKDFYTQIDKFFDLWNSSNRLWIIIDETHNINVKLDESNLIHFLYLEKLNQRLSPTTLLKQIKKKKFNYELAIKKSLNNLNKVNRNFFNLKQLAFSELVKNIKIPFEYAICNSNFLKNKFKNVMPDIALIKFLNDKNAYVVLCKKIKNSTLQNLCVSKSILYCYNNHDRADFKKYTIKIGRIKYVKNITTR